MLCLRLGIGMLICLVLQIVFQHATDRLQSAAGFMIFADMRMKLGEHLRRMPMGYFTEGNIGKISSVLSSGAGAVVVVVVVISVVVTVVVTEG